MLLVFYNILYNPYSLCCLNMFHGFGMRIIVICSNDTKNLFWKWRFCFWKLFESFRMYFFLFCSLFCCWKRIEKWVFICVTLTFNFVKFLKTLTVYLVWFCLCRNCGRMTEDSEDAEDLRKIFGKWKRLNLKNDDFLKKCGVPP